MSQKRSEFFTANIVGLSLAQNETNVQENQQDVSQTTSEFLTARIVTLSLAQSEPNVQENQLDVSQTRTEFLNCLHCLFVSGSK